MLSNSMKKILYTQRLKVVDLTEAAVEAELDPPFSREAGEREFLVSPFYIGGVAS